MFKSFKQARLQKYLIFQHLVRLRFLIDLVWLLGKHVVGRYSFSMKLFPGTYTPTFLMTNQPSLSFPTFVAY